jgi:hypothetical protein
MHDCVLSGYESKVCVLFMNKLFKNKILDLVEKQFEDNIRKFVWILEPFH